MSTRDVGTDYEEVAIRHLSQFGLELVAQNYRLNNGEIDIIMRDDEFFIFVEVKYRASAAFADVLEQISAKQLQRVRHAARVWLAKHQLSEHTTACRFDIIAITGHPFNIEWLKDAF
ncbi:YraN family protein [Aliidiomarina indica]|uniref:YraN family protein n=1 Tax=Aliidiomarina indica TaxID=2749147 RepID=UPI001890900E|nr:YraN family protein [Aliidiomarina indica]